MRSKLIKSDSHRVNPTRRSRPSHQSQIRPRIQVLVGAWKQYGRGIIEGIWQYAQNRAAWLVDLDPMESDENTSLHAHMAIDGIIAMVHTRAFADKLRKYRVPIVNVSGTRIQGIHFPRVTTDPDAVLRMAIEHLRDKGFKNIAFCGEPSRHFVDFWMEAYRVVMAEQNREPLIYAPDSKLPRRGGERTRPSDLLRWIKAQPKPVGMIGWDSAICRQIALDCAATGIHVPDEVAIVSLESDELLCKMIHPPLSGLDIPVEQIGYEAARLLDLLLQGRKKEAKNIFLPPRGVITRQSSDVFTVDDPKLRQALRYIKNHATEQIHVRDILRAVPMARRTLERRFNELLGRSPSEEIRRTKIEKVRELLVLTNMPVPDVAEAAGFEYVEHMIPLFKKYHGLTPAKYRSQARAGG